MLESISPAFAADVDQAAGLRRLFGAHKARAVAFVSGREACGRTALLVRTATALAEAGQGVVIIDENAGADNVHAALGIKVRHDLLALVQGDVSIEQLVQPVAPFLSVISAARFAAAPLRTNTVAAERLNAALRQLQDGCTFILVDCVARHDSHLSPLALAMPHLVVVVAAQGAAITRGYALIKHLSRAYGRERFHVAITKARTEQAAQVIFHNMRNTAHAHLNVVLNYLGSTRVEGGGFGSDHLASALQSHLVSVGDHGDELELRPCS